MATRLSKTRALTLTLAALALSLGTGCSHHKPASTAQQSDAANLPPPDAGTDAVPQAAVEDRSGDTSAEVPPPPTADNAAAVPPAPTADQSAPPTASPDMAQNPPQDQAQPQAPQDQAPQDQAQAPAPEAAPQDQAAAAPPSDNAPAPATADDNGNYTVRAGDTLMKIAFDNYGDLYKWKEIYEANKDRIPNPNALPPGTVLKLAKSDAPVTIERNGDQYLIKSGDTLGTISKDVYGTTHKWKKLWENNKQLIKDPNRIYAGFYLYYTLTPTEKLGYEKRHGENPTPVADANDANQAPSSDDSRAPASVTPNAMPAPLAAPAPAKANPVTAPQANAADTPPPSGNSAPAPAAENEARMPASVNPPTMDANTLTSGEVVPPPAEMLNTPPPVQHSADLNQLVEQAEKQDTSQAAAATAGP